MAVHERPDAEPVEDPATGSIAVDATGEIVPAGPPAELAAPWAYERPDRHPLVVYLASLGSPASVASMRSSARRVARLVGHEDPFAVPWHLFDYAHVAAIVARLREDVSATSAAKILCMVRGTLRAAWRLGLMSSDQYERARDVRVKQSRGLLRGRMLTLDELRALFAACPLDTALGLRDRAILAAMCSTGVRRSELVSVSLQRVDLGTGEGRVLGKGNRERYVYFTPETVSAIRAWLVYRGDGKGPLFVRCRRGGTVGWPLRPLTSSGLRLAIERVRRAAKVASFAPHDLRRTFISRHLDAGRDLALVARLVGHASVATTVRYDRREERAAREAAQSLPIPIHGGSA